MEGLAHNSDLADAIAYFEEDLLNDEMDHRKVTIADYSWPQRMLLSLHRLYKYCTIATFLLYVV